MIARTGVRQIGHYLLVVIYFLLKAGAQAALSVPSMNTSISHDDLLGDEDRLALLRLARDSIRHGLDHGAPLPVDPMDYAEALRLMRATFVTLRIGTELRGCIGVLEAKRSLVGDVAENAFAAAFRDTRFSPVTAHEFSSLHIHVSILSPPVLMNVL